jgi:hypothetical protein
MALFWRIIFLLAIFGNLLFFAWSQGYFGRLEDGREPLRLERQLGAEKLRVVAGPNETANEAAHTSTATTATAGQPICRLVGSNELPAADAQRLYEQVQAAAEAQLQAVVKPVELPPRYWVYFPPLPNRALVEKKQQELRNLGITDAMPMYNEGADHLAISLGMFSTLEAANAHLAAMKQRGVRTAVVAPRSRTTGKAQVEIRGQQASVEQHLPEFLKNLKLDKLPISDCPAQPEAAAESAH